MVLSNFDPQDPKDKTYKNDSLLKQIITEIDPDRFNLKILNEVFKSFLSSRPKLIRKIKKEDFENLQAEVPFKNKCMFDYDNRTWVGTIVKHKWYPKEDGPDWFTYSIKLPNDGYFYNQSYQDKSIKGEYLKEDAFHVLEDIFNFIFEFFGDHKFQTRVFYLTWRNRMNVKAVCEELRVWLQITFENGLPKEKVTEWYDETKLKDILEKQKNKKK
jgi:hypothetical protein